MPIYEYQCGSCSNQVELRMPYENTSTDIKCVKCGSSMSKLVSKTSFKLEGDCWEQDGYGRSKQRV